MKYSITCFGDETCDPCCDNLYGFTTSLIYRKRKIKFKTSFGFALASQTSDIFIYITPLILCFKL